MLFLVRPFVFFSIVLNAHGLTPAQKESIDHMKEAAKSYQGRVHALTRQSVHTVQAQGNPLTQKKESGACPIGDSCLSGPNVMPMKSGQDAEPYLMQGKNPVVFVSASMPLAALKNLAHQARKEGAVLVIRGFIKGTLKDTANLVDEINFPLEIDPKLFEKYQVQHVPTLMVYEKNIWHKVTGNVEIRFAKEMAKKKAKGATS